jgi:hypothetical protein
MAPDQFPIPSSGTVKIIPRSQDTFDIEITGLNTADRDAVVGFFMKMRGRFGSFRFEYAGTAYAECRFDSDTGPAVHGGSGPHDVTVPIKILQP